MDKSSLTALEVLEVTSKAMQFIENYVREREVDPNYAAISIRGVCTSIFGMSIAIFTKEENEVEVFNALNDMLISQRAKTRMAIKQLWGDKYG